MARVRFDPAEDALPTPPDPFLVAFKKQQGLGAGGTVRNLLTGNCFVPEEGEWSEGDELMHEYEERLRQVFNLRII